MRKGTATPVLMDVETGVFRYKYHLIPDKHLSYPNPTPFLLLYPASRTFSDSGQVSRYSPGLFSPRRLPSLTQASEQTYRGLQLLR